MTLFLSGHVGDQHRVWPLELPQVAIGRSSRNSIAIADSTISKEHAEIVRRGDKYFVRDLGSRNGTRVNGAHAAEPTEIRSGDRLEIGHVVLSVTDRDPSEPVRLNEASMVGTSLRLRADQILDRRVRSGHASQQMMRLLAEAGRLLVLPRPLHETCDEILGFVERAVPASRHILLLRRDTDGEPVQIAARTRGGRANEALALSGSIMRMVLDECTSVLTADAASDPRFRGQQSIVAQAVRSAMAVPLFDNEKVLGLIYVDSHDPTLVFGEEQLELLTILANMAAVKITNGRLLEAEQAQARLAQELATAAQIQRGLLPVTPQVAGYEIEAFIETCYEVGGDLYDFHLDRDGALHLVVGDVTGKGMGAALLMSSFLASARVLYETCETLAEFATRLGAIMNRSTDPKRFVTGFVGRLDPATGTLEYVNAGHPLPILMRNGELRELESTGVPFGVLPHFPYLARSVDLAGGEVLALFSDGIPEAQRGEELFGDQRLHEAMRGTLPTDDLATLRDRVLERVRAFVGDAPRSDDITLVLIRRG